MAYVRIKNLQINLHKFGGLIYTKRQHERLDGKGIGDLVLLVPRQTGILEKQNE